MVEILIGGVERIIDFERAAGIGESAKHVHIALEHSRPPPAGSYCVHSNATRAGTCLSHPPVCLYAVTAEFASAPGGCYADPAKAAAARG